MGADDLRAVAAVRALGSLRTDRWPMVAAHLVAAGAEGAALVELAGLSRLATTWEVDELLDAALAEAGVAPVDDVADAGRMLARLLAGAVRATGSAPEHAVIRALAVLWPRLGYPADGVLDDAYSAAEWLDCDCHRDSPEREAADALEAELRAAPPLDVDPGLLAALTPDGLLGPESR